jgi:hypothetical protein
MRGLGQEAASAMGFGVFLGKALPAKVLCERRPQNGSDNHQNEHGIDCRLVNQPNSCRIFALEGNHRRGQSRGDLRERERADQVPLSAGITKLSLCQVSGQELGRNQAAHDTYHKAQLVHEGMEKGRHFNQESDAHKEYWKE